MAPGAPPFALCKVNMGFALWGGDGEETAGTWCCSLPLDHLKSFIWELREPEVRGSSGVHFCVREASLTRCGSLSGRSLRVLQATGVQVAGGRGLRTEMDCDLRTCSETSLTDTLVPNTIMREDFDQQDFLIRCGLRGRMQIPVKDLTDKSLLVTRSVMCLRDRMQIFLKTSSGMYS